jgi:diguanylate cyclase (GGDEF)-like protein
MISEAEQHIGRITRLKRRVDRERRARREAETLLEAKSLELYSANCHLTALARDLETHVLDRTRELDVSRQQAQFLAERDPLTALANRLSFARDLDQAINSASDEKRSVHLLLIDLDRFKEVNDNYGHAVGNAVLCEVAERLRAACGEEETISRLGGDEFAVLCRSLFHQERGREVAAVITEAMGRPINYHQQQLPLTCSIGIARFPQDATDSTDLQRFADVALYRSKAAGRSMWTAFDEKMAAELRSRHGLEADLRSAVTDGSVEPWYQPIVSSETGSIIGVEALARWQHPERGPLLPGLFIPIAEESSLIIDLGRAMIDRSCREMQPLIRDGRLKYVSVNLSTRHLRHHSVADDITAALARHRFPSAGLQLEITESLLISDFDQAEERLLRFRGLGIRIALDDFGTGYSSLAYIRRLPLDVIKIDRSFSRDISADRQGQEVIRAIIQLARALNLGVVTEGVETESQALRLTACGCSVLQGYLFGRPMPLHALMQVLEAPSNLVLNRAG